MLRNYESMIILIPALSEEESNQANQEILDYIKKTGGEPSEPDVWGKRQLAYEIKSFKEGYYFVNKYQYEPSKISELERIIKINEKVIRYNILVKE
ncbi:MAG: 30S ribosomal protein S6 [Candidatus Cloacimonetes bacterium]|nr:30S ribosomal protein S6 [Candidatus Cloacimonadota bacterium]